MSIYSTVLIYLLIMMICRFKRKGLIIMSFWLISLMFLPIIVIAINKTILIDSKADLYCFTNKQLNEITDTRIDPENSISIRILNNVFRDLVNSRSKATKTANPDKMDLTDLEYDGSNLNLVMNSDNLIFDDMEAMVGFIWNSESVFIVFMLLDTYLYVDCTDLVFDDIVPEDFQEIEVSGNTFTLNDISDDFSNKNYVKGFLVYTDLNNPNNNIIEMFTTEPVINWGFIRTLFWIIIIVILIIVAIIIISK